MRCREHFAVAFRYANGMIGTKICQTRLAVRTTMWHTMVALRVVPINANSGLDKPAVTAHRPAPTVVAVCLFLLLVFSTTTVFVRDAWALQSFQIGVFALLAAYLIVGIRRGKEHIAGGLAPWLVYMIPLWGLIQILAHTTTSSVETREAVLRWAPWPGYSFSPRHGPNPDSPARHPERISNLRDSDGGALPHAAFSLPRAMSSGYFRPAIGRLCNVSLLQQLRSIRGAGLADRPLAGAARGLAVLVVCACRRSSLCVCDWLGIACRLGALHGGTADYAGDRVGEVAGSGDGPAHALYYCDTRDGSGSGSGIHSCCGMGARLAALSTE